MSDRMLADEVGAVPLREAQQRKDLMTANQVAKHLGVGIRTFRRMLSNGQFPPAVIESKNGRRDYWLRIDVMAFQQIALKQKIRQSKRARYTTVDAIEEAMEKRLARLDLEAQIHLKNQRTMWSLFYTDPEAFMRRYPSLKNWAQEKYEALAKMRLSRPIKK